MRKHNGLAEFVREISEDIIVGAVIAKRCYPANGVDDVFARRHCWTEGKLHAFEHLRDNPTGRQFDGHPDRFEAGPKTASRYPAVETCHHANVRVEKWGNNLTDAIRCDAHVAVRDDQVIAGALGD